MKKRTLKALESYWRHHILPSPLSRMVLQAVTPADVERLLDGLRADGYSAQTVKHVRSTLRGFFAWAIEKERLMRGDNPAARTEAVHVPRPTPKALSHAQAQALLLAVLEMREPAWTLMVLLAAYTGMRKGEILGLLWRKVDLAGRTILVDASYEDTDKTGVGERVPIHQDLLPFLEAAFRARQSEWVIPGPDGRMRTENFDAAGWTRRTLVCAGITGGWEVRCQVLGAAPCGRRNPKAKLDEEKVARLRAMHAAGASTVAIGRELGVTHQAVAAVLKGRNWRHGTGRGGVGCGFKETREADGAGTPCPRCGRPLRSKPLPLPFTFKHLRSTLGTLLAEQTGSLWAAQTMLRHGSSRTTERHYAARHTQATLQVLDTLKLLPPEAVGGGRPPPD